LDAVIERLNLFLRGWGNYFRTGNAGDKFVTARHFTVKDQVSTAFSSG